MQRLCVIFNPAARGERSHRTLDFVATKSTRSHQVVIAPTERTGDAQRLAAWAVSEGHEMIVAAGGDGTINEVVNGIGTSGVPLAILPGGTVNVLALELGIPFRLDAAWKIIEQGSWRAIDLGRVEANGTSRYFAQLAGVGLDAVSVRNTNWKMKKRFGPLSYVWAGLKTIGSHDAVVEVESRTGIPACAAGEKPNELASNGRTTSTRGGLVLIGNGRFYGGRFAVFPDARMDDGLLDVCIFHKGGYLNVLRYLQGVWRGVHTGFDDVTYFQTNGFVCRSPVPVPFEVEGEVAGDVPATFSVLPRALRVIAPA